MNGTMLSREAREPFLRMLRRHTFVTVGCTDPVAVGLAAAAAYRLTGGNVRRIVVEMDRNIYKDAISVGIPGTMEIGLPLAVALAVLRGDPDEGLRLLRGVTADDVVRAKECVQAWPMEFRAAGEEPPIYVKALVETDRGVGEAVIRGGHDRIVETVTNGVRTVLAQETAEDDGDPDLLDVVSGCSMEDLLRAVESFDMEELDFLAEGVDMNLAAAKAGERGGCGPSSSPIGLGLGAQYAFLARESFLRDDLVNRVKRKVAAAADARMAGCDVPIFGCYGSGNHGITLFLTVGLAARHYQASWEATNRALALSLLIVGVIKSRTGILTPHCGCAVAAGTGAAGGIAWLQGGRAREIENAVHLMMGNLTGMLCDGAKYGCALKMATSAGAAVESAAMAALGGAFLPERNGIVGRNFQHSMDNLRKITDVGMRDVDRSVLEILLDGEPSEGTR
ncbi:L-serine ammonia-lyase, iron-sulfur-dependent, subunit alpha [Aminiphilus sp.]|uniref:L-serine ammonia-lyase, iron-sulfur-dependent, subunit alpha n=1 Tax=Aminiphilus sp. TaxID=1872488 RepID=UPI002605DB7C|nr:L-serine ammonia-lyase, iron-sulfur-dependent, subunit alpha [Aminiphilus sp.]